MRVLQRIAIIYAALYLLTACAVPPQVDARSISILDVVPIGTRMATELQEGSIAIIYFSKKGTLASHRLMEIQFRVENGRLGLEWRRVSEWNLRRSNDFFNFVKPQGFKIYSREYGLTTRVEDPENNSLPQLCESILTDLFKVPLDGEIGLYYEGISLSTW